MNAASSLEFTLAEYADLWKDCGLTLSPQLQLHARAALERGAKQPSSSVASAPAEITSVNDIAAWMGNCQRCPLSAGRNRIVLGEGNVRSRLLLVGEGPGADEDREGRPFVGKAGQLLDKILNAMHYQREEVYITNVVKCRPPQNRVPAPDEVAACSGFLKAQIELTDPALILALGLTAAVTLTGQTTTMANLRGKIFPLVWNPEIRVIPTYHPAYLLRNPDAKRIVWDDMRLAMAQLGKQNS